MYIRLCPDSFGSDQIKVSWAMSYMKSGRAAKWAARIFRWEEENPGRSHFLDWDHFKDEFRKEFCPSHSDSAAINRLESVTYFQNRRSVDDYLDEFLDLIADAGYTDPKTIVVKFRRGLDPQIQNAVATMPNGRPSDVNPTSWYTAARNIDQNRASNEAFRSAYKVLASQSAPSSAPLRIIPRSVAGTSRIDPSPGNPVPMDVDSAKRRGPLPFVCYRCGKTGHKAPDCKLPFDIRALTSDQLEAELGHRYAQLDAVDEDDQVISEKKAETSDFVQDNE
jgi:hypothetical protein